jgi:predicted small integral membrane protein
MTLRVAKTLLVAAVAIFYTLIVFNNTTDYGTNYQFVHHVLLMDTIFPGNQVMWRAIHPSIVQVVFYDGIICWESLTMVLTWVGVVRLLWALRRSAGDFNSAKRFSIAALTLGMLLWFVAFISVGGEWFLMWESKLWNGQEAAFRMFAVIGIVLVLLVLPDTETQP